MKRQFESLDLQCWEHQGRLGAATPCLCFQGSAEVAAVLLAAVEELRSEGPPARRSLTLRFAQRRKSVQKILLIYSAEREQLRQMSLTKKATTATLEFTPKGLEAFRAAVECWRDGGEDFSLHPIGSRKPRQGELGSKDIASGELWFWTLQMEP